MTRVEERLRDVADIPHEIDLKNTEPLILKHNNINVDMWKSKKVMNRNMSTS